MISSGVFGMSQAAAIVLHRVSVWRGYFMRYSADLRVRRQALAARELRGDRARAWRAPSRETRITLERFWKS